MIKSGGECISSIDLENAAVGCAGVAEAAAIGIPHPKWDERPLLLIVRSNGSNACEQAVRDHIATRIPARGSPTQSSLSMSAAHGDRQDLQEGLAGGLFGLPVLTDRLGPALASGFDRINALISLSSFAQFVAIRTSSAPSSRLPSATKDGGRRLLATAGA